MIELEMRGLGLFGAVLLLSTGTLAQVQQPRSACIENAIVVLCTAGSHAERTTSAERDRPCTICGDDLRLISFPLSSDSNQKTTVQPDGMVARPTLGSLYVQGSTLHFQAWSTRLQRHTRSNFRRRSLPCQDRWKNPVNTVCGMNSSVASGVEQADVPDSVRCLQML